MSFLEIRPNVLVEGEVVKTGYTITEEKKEWEIFGSELTQIKEISFGEFSSFEKALQKARRSQLLNGAGTTLSIGTGACLAFGSLIKASAENFDFQRFATDPLSPGVIGLVGLYLVAGVGRDLSRREEGSFKVAQRLREMINLPPENPVQV